MIDGNMKNNREVCYAVDAGYAEYGNLPGRVKTGCPNTPAHKSRYCSIHAPLVTSVKVSADGNEQSTSSSTDEERVAGIITSKRTTRNSILYQVHIPPYPYVCVCIYMYIVQSHK